MLKIPKVHGAIVMTVFTLAIGPGNIMLFSYIMSTTNLKLVYAPGMTSHKLTLSNWGYLDSFQVLSCLVWN